MSKTIRRVYATDYAEAKLNEMKWGVGWYTMNYANHCANKVARFNTRHTWPVPKWWDKVMHTRPRRAQERMAIRQLLAEGGDYDGDIVFPLSKKPHNWYW